MPWLSEFWKLTGSPLKFMAQPLPVSTEAARSLSGKSPEPLDLEKYLRELEERRLRENLREREGSTTYHLRNAKDALTDAGSRLARGAVEGTGEAIAGLGSVGDSVATAVDAGQLRLAEAIGLPTETLRTQQEQGREKFGGLNRAAQAGGEEVRALGEFYRPDPARENNLLGQVAQGLGSMAPAIATGPAAPLAMGSMMGEQGRRDAAAHGAGREGQAAAFLANAPVGVASEALLGVPALLKSVAGQQGTSALARMATQVVKGAAREGAQEAIEQITGNVIASDVVGYDEDRKTTEGVGQAAVVGALTGGAVAGAFQGAQELDTGKNVPESVETLKAQQEQLLAGRRKAQMFPKGSLEIPMPKGMERFENARGIFHFNPELVSREEVAKASEQGRENELLGLGPLSKPEAMKRAAAGDPELAVTERTPDGTEVKTAVATKSTAPAVAAELEKIKTPGNAVAVEPVAKVINERKGGNFIDEMLAADARKITESKAEQQKEIDRRAVQMQELGEKRTRFDERVRVAGETLRNPKAGFAEVKGALESMKFYAEDNSLGLAQDQRETAGRLRAWLEKQLAPLDRDEQIKRDAAALTARTGNANAEAAKKAKVRAEIARVDAIERTGRDPETGEIVQLSKVPDDELEALMPDDEGLSAQEIDSEMSRRMEAEERQQAEGQAAPYTLRDLFVGRKDVLRAAGIKAPLRLPTPATERGRGGLGGELQALQEGAVPFAYFEGSAKSLDVLAEQLRELGFDQAKTESDVLDMISRAFAGEDVRPAFGNPDGVEFAAAQRAQLVTENISQQQLDQPLDAIELPPAEAFQKTSRENREQMAPQLARLGIVENPYLGRLQLSGKRRSHLLHDSGGPDGFRMLAVLRDILRTAQPVGAQETDNQGRQETKVKRAIAAVSSGGEIFPVRITLHTDANGTFVHSVNLLRTQKRPTSSNPRPTTEADKGIMPGKLTVAQLLRGVKPTAGGSFTAEFSTPATPAPARVLNEGQAQREIAAIRKAFPKLVRGYDVELGDLKAALKREGFRGAVPSSAQAAVMPAQFRQQLDRVNAHRDLIVLSARAWRDRAKGSALLVHEIGHRYWDMLPTETKEILRELHRAEIENKTGPLYGKDGTKRTELKYIDEDSERGVKEWFAERIARLNEDWARDRIDREATPSALLRAAARVREFILRIWNALAHADADGELFQRAFRDWVLQGARSQEGAAQAGITYAQRKGVEFATGENPDQLRQRADELQKQIAALAESQEEASDIEARGKALRDELVQVKQQLAAVQREARAARSVADVKHPAAAATPEPGDAWASIAKMDTAALKKERASITKYISDHFSDLSEIERSNLSARVEAIKRDEARRADEIIAAAPRVEPLPVIDRQTALRDELARGRKLRDEGERTVNLAAQEEGLRLVRQAREQLDDEFPGWDKNGGKTAGKKTASPSVASTPAESAPGDGEQSPFEPTEEAPPVRPGKANEVYGQSAYQPTALLRSWKKVRAVLVGIKGAVPELPTFPAAKWNQDDDFIGEQGPQFYNRLREFLRVLRSGNDYVQKTSEEDVAKIVSPLLEIGGRFNAEDYKKLQQRQEQVRRLRGEGKAVPPGVAAEIAALNSKLETSPYVLFQKLVLMLDLNWRHQNLKDSQGNPVALPGGMNSSEVRAELQRLGSAIEASHNGAAIKTALRTHMDLVQRVAAELKGRELLAAEHLANPYYFPHITLETTRGGKVEQRELQPEKVRPGTEADFRGYLIDPVGSTKPIETDYVRAVYFHLVQVNAHNLKADAVRDYARPYDIMAKVRDRAQKLSRERGAPVSWEQAFHEEFSPGGYVLYGTDSRDAFPSISIDRDKLAHRLGVMLTSEDIHRQFEALGLKGIKLLPEDLKETLQMGTRETWVVPARVAEALRGIAQRETKQDSAIEAAAKWTLGKWKAWKLFMPWNHVRYEYGNVVADLEKLFSASPRTFRYLGPAAKELREFWQGGTPSEDLRAALKEGVINAVTAQEMNQLQRLRAFEKFETRAENAWRQTKKRASSALYQPFTNALGLGDLSSVEMSAFREGVTRYAKFKGDLEAIRNSARPDYAGAYWRDIEAMEDSRPGAGDVAVRKAAAISKATFGDYGDLSVMGETLRDKLIPFYSWMEINFRYHANLLRNLRDMVRAGEIARADGVKAGARAAGTAAAGFTARAAGGVALRLALPYVAVMLWNNGDDREELEKLLSEEDRRRFHIIVGERKDGNTTLRDGRKIEVIYANTAAMDVMKWFSGPAFMQQMGAWMGGKTDFPTAFTAWRDQLAPDFVNNFVGSFGPYLKIPYTLASKKNPFPDVLDQRTVPAHDMRRVILGQMADDFTADRIENLVNKDYYSSKDMGDWSRQLILQVRQRDPEQWAFYEIKDKAATFLEKQTGADRDTSYNAPDQQVLRNFRRAIYGGDVENATRFYLRLLDYGYTAERFQASIRAQAPLAGLPKAQQQPFIASLSEFEREQLTRANDYYQRIAVARRHERQLFPSARSGQRGLDRFRAYPQTPWLEGLMEANP